jgi:AraC family L-rhamnose operon transcriptional activator RhaR/AraC family L-rhamnose operon regulatory protein RhaS
MDKFIFNQLQKQNSSKIIITKYMHTNDCPLHQHDFSELVIAINGQATHVIENKEYLLKSGDIFVIKGNTSHGYFNPDNFEIYNIAYKRDFLLSQAKELKKIPGFQALFILEPFFRANQQFQTMFHLDDLSYTLNLNKMMLNAYKNNTDGLKYVITTYFKSLLMYLADKYIESSYLNKNDNSNLIDIANTISYMENNYTKPINLKELAEKASLSPRHFSRIFNENYQTSPIDYLIHLRIKHACSLLKKTDMNITNIAIKSGFNDGNYFSRQFKKIMAVSPRKYRENPDNFTIPPA